MVVVRLWGGLGNQLFQYAFGYAVSQKMNCELKLDCSFFSEEFQSKNKRFTRQLPLIIDLPILNNDTNIPHQIVKKVEFLQKKNINRLIRIPKHFKKEIDNDFFYVKETRPCFDPYYCSFYDEDIYFDGYWQCEEYFKDFKKDLTEQFIPQVDQEKLKPIISDMVSRESIAVHIRRGDYVTSKSKFSSLYVLQKEYYDNCFKSAREIFNAPYFYFFSNDIEWVKRNFGEKDNYIFISEQPGLSTMDEFYLMSCCKNQIIGNSTFSWWAAWLNKNENKLVWCPDKWFGNVDILPTDWIKTSIV